MDDLQLVRQDLLKCGKPMQELILGVRGTSSYYLAQFMTEWKEMGSRNATSPVRGIGTERILTSMPAQQNRVIALCVQSKR